jgi:hypothetical protein
MRTKQGNGMLRNARNLTLAAGMALALDHSTLMRADTPKVDQAALKQFADRLMGEATTNSSMTASMRIGDERLSAKLYQTVGDTKDWRRALELAAATYEGEGTQSGFSNAAVLYLTLGDKKREQEVSAPIRTDIGEVNETMTLVSTGVIAIYSVTTLGFLYLMRKQQELDNQNTK